jgi:hypothetical protein
VRVQDGVALTFVTTFDAFVFEELCAVIDANSCSSNWRSCSRRAIYWGEYVVEDAGVVCANANEGIRNTEKTKKLASVFFMKESIMSICIS